MQYERAPHARGPGRIEADRGGNFSHHFLGESVERVARETPDRYAAVILLVAEAAARPAEDRQLVAGVTKRLRFLHDPGVSGRVVCDQVKNHLAGAHYRAPPVPATLRDCLAERTRWFRAMSPSR